MIQRLNNPQPQLLPLLILRHRYILNMPHQPQVVDELPLHDERPRSHNRLRPVQHHEDEVVALARFHPVVAGVPRGLGDVADFCEDFEDVEEALLVVGAVEGADGVVFGEGGEDGEGDEGGGEEGVGGGGGRGGHAERVVFVVIRVV